MRTESALQGGALLRGGCCSAPLCRDCDPGLAPPPHWVALHPPRQHLVPGAGDGIPRNPESQADSSSGLPRSTRRRLSNRLLGLGEGRDRGRATLCLCVSSAATPGDPQATSFNAGSWARQSALGSTQGSQVTDGAGLSALTPCTTEMLWEISHCRGHGLHSQKWGSPRHPSQQGPCSLHHTGGLLAFLPRVCKRLSLWEERLISEPGRPCTVR